MNYVELKMLNRTGGGVKYLFLGLIAVLLLFNGVTIQAQNCIDIEQIKTDLSNIEDNCNCENPLVLGTPNQTTYISTYQLGFRVLNECIEVYGTLVLDQAIHFHSSDFIFDDGALIKLNNSLASVSFVRCNLQSCGDYFWDGIDIGGQNSFYFVENTMQHAFNGIHASSLPVFTYFYGNVFNDNRYAIDIATKSHPINRRSEITLVGNIFGQSNDLKLHWEDPPLWAHELSEGVRSSHAIVNSLVGNETCDRTNIFIGLYNGYYLRNSISQIHADLFHGIQDPWSNKVAGIVAYPTRNSWIGANSLIQTGWPTNDIETFNEIDFPIFVSGSAASIEGNIINKAERGIFLDHLHMLSDVKNNEIQTHLGEGIIAFQNNTPSEIADNIINIQHYSQGGFYHSRANGIRIYTSYPPAPIRSRTGSSGTQIRENSIDLNPGINGIFASGPVNLYNISCNTIDIHETVGNSVSGIRLDGGSQNDLVKNTITGLYSSSTANQINGIRIVNSQENHLYANHTKNTSIGFQFSAWNNHTTQLQNTFEDHDIGYFVRESGVTGQQFFPANRWLGSFSEWAALNEGDLVPSRYNDYQNLQQTDCWPGSISPDPGWFYLLQGTGNCSGSSDPECENEVEAELESLTYLDTLIARGELEFDDFEDGRIWQAERYLLKNLTEFPNLIGSPGSLMDSFYINAQTQVLWDYHGLRIEMEQLSILPDSFSTEWFKMFDQYEDLITSAEGAIDDWLVFPDSLELAEPISDVYEVIDSIWTESFEAYQSYREEYVDNLVSLLPGIMALSTPNAYAASEKLIFEARVKMAQSKDSVNSSLRNDLLQLAESCLLEKGPSVIEASVMVKQLGLEPADYALHCVEPSGQRWVEPVSSENSFEIFPNPATGYFTLEFKANLEQAGSVKMYSRNGQLVFSATLNSDSKIQEFSVDHLPAGQYIIKVKHNGEKESRSMIIAR